MTGSLSEVRTRLRAADLALAMATGGSSELAHVREAVGSLLVAMHELVGLYEEQPALNQPSHSGSPRKALARDEAPTKAKSPIEGGTVGGTPAAGARRPRP